MYINGEWCDAEDGGTVGIINPADAEVIERVPYGGRAECRRALEAAHSAFDTWRHATAYERGDVLLKAARLMRERVEDIARIMTMEVGKTLAESTGETLAAAAQLEWYSEEGKRAYGRWIPPSKGSARRWVLRHPIGVAGTISPWNFPVLLPLRKVAPALAAGCTTVVRPATQAPLALAEAIGCLHDAGAPPGVVNLVMGRPKEISGEFFSNRICKKVSFTGSTAAGKELIRQSADQVKKLSLELGGSAPVLVFPDVDVQEAAEVSVFGKFRNNGQVCISPARFYVHQSIADEYIAACVERAKALRLGNGLDEDTDVGPMFDEEGQRRAQGFVDDAVAKGAALLCGGGPPAGSRYEKGFFFEPTVLANVSRTMRVTCEETFCPVMPIMTFDTVQQAVALANDTEYGLAAYVLTNDLQRAIRVAEALEFGIVGLNDFVPATAEAPFGGMKESGLGGREGGIEGLEPYLEVKYVSVGL
ncbi:MAG: NAD-dependent succinate-semialdehyde dehydrogenase [Armatimonadota bacterium]